MLPTKKNENVEGENVELITFTNMNKYDQYHYVDQYHLCRR